MTDATTTDHLRIRSLIDRALRGERAASLVEYALLVALVALIALGGIAVLGSSTDALLGDSGSSILQAGS